MTYAAALAAFSRADLARQAALEAVKECERRLAYARAAFVNADEASKVAMYRAEDTYRREEYAAGRPVTLDTKPPTNERTAP